jgi:hypothetical protein
MSSVPSKADQRIKEDLDLFLLVLIQVGINTPYRMQTAAGITQGSSLQSLKRLTVRKLVRVAAEGPRGRIEFLLTAAGRRWLDKGSSHLANEEPTGDMDSVLRKGLIVAFVHENPKRAAEYFRRAAVIRRHTQFVSTYVTQETPEIARHYSRFRQTRSSLIAVAEAEVLEQAAAELARSSKRKR